MYLKEAAIVITLNNPTYEWNMDLFEDIHGRPVSACVGPPLPAEQQLVDYPSEAVPPYDAGTCLLHPYSELRRTADPVFSTPLHVHGLTWRLKVYPVCSLLLVFLRV